MKRRTKTTSAVANVSHMRRIQRLWLICETLQHGAQAATDQGNDLWQLRHQHGPFDDERSFSKSAAFSAAQAKS